MAAFDYKTMQQCYQLTSLFERGAEIHICFATLVLNVLLCFTLSHTFLGLVKVLSFPSCPAPIRGRVAQENP